MIIIDCPSCSVQFRVPSGAVPPEGRDLRCSSCGHVWHYVDPLVASLEQPEDEIPNPSFLAQVENSTTSGSFAEVLKNTELPDMVLPPVSTAAGVPVMGRFNHATILGYAGAALMALIVLQILSFSQGVTTAIIPRLKVIYELLGVHVPPSVTPLLFENVNLAKDGKKITIKGTVINETERQRNIPSIRAGLMVKGQKMPLASWVFRADKTFVDVKSKNGAVSFSITREIDRADDVTDVQLQFVE